MLFFSLMFHSAGRTDTSLFNFLSSCLSVPLSVFHIGNRKFLGSLRVSGREVLCQYPMILRLSLNKVNRVVQMYFLLMVPNL